MLCNAPRLSVFGVLLFSVLPAVAARADDSYVSIDPCRIADTRSAGGAVGAGTTRTFFVRDPNPGGTHYASQGGISTAGCGIPGLTGGNPQSNIAKAAMVNIIAVSPAGAGDLRAFAANKAAPLSSVVNYASVPGLNIANGVIVPLCDEVATNPCASGDLAIRADAAATQVVIDVLGYFQTADFVSRTGDSMSGTLTAPIVSASDLIATLNVIGGTRVRAGSPTNPRCSGSGDVCASTDLVADGKVQAGVTTNAACSGDGAVCGHGNVAADGNVVSGGFGALQSAARLICGGAGGTIESSYSGVSGASVVYAGNDITGRCIIDVGFPVSPDASAKRFIAANCFRTTALQSCSVSIGYNSSANVVVFDVYLNGSATDGQEIEFMVF